MKRSWDFGSFEITLREVIASISIVAIMLTIGFVIAGKIEANQIDKNAEYYKAVHITDTVMFQYGMDTNLGNAFVYGNLQAVDTVTYPEIGGNYMYVKKVKERYTMHTRTVTTTVNGKPQTRTEVYWTWDRVGSEEIHSDRIKFLNIEMEYNKIQMPSTNHIETIKESSHVRYKYYVCYPEYTGTLYTQLHENQISESSPFYPNQTIEETLEQKTSGIGLYIFWILWMVLIVAAVIGFCYLDNRWLVN